MRGKLETGVNMVHKIQFAMALILAAAAPAIERASAEVVAVGGNGFEVRETVRTAAPDKVYGALLNPAHWWNSEHTFSGSAANLALDARAGGCWCETLPDGGAPPAASGVAGRHRS